jgi:hypothetical protein
MARSTTTASHRTESVDHALWRAAAQSWHALGLTAVASILIAPVLVVGVLTILEAALSGSNTQSTVRPAPEQAPAGWGLTAPRLLNYRPHAGAFSLRHA